MFITKKIGIIGLILPFTFYLLPSTWLYSRGTSTTIFQLLDASFGARQKALGETFTAIADDINTIYYNPAGLKNISNKTISATYQKGLSDLSQGFVVYSQESEKLRGTVACGFTYLYGGKIELNYTDRPSETKQAQSDYLLTLSYATGDKLKFGSNLKVVYSELVEDAKATGFCIDLGFHYSMVRIFKKEVSFGLSTQNIGPWATYSGGLASGKEYEPLPITSRAGFSVLTISTKNHNVVIASDWLFPYYVNKGKFHTGLEYTYRQKYFLRTGYKLGYALDSFTFGLGTKFSKYQLDYGLALMGELSPTHHLTFTMKL
ncbi:MAG: PorV/PorQ family protein [Elusimicrobiota bacterium]